MLVAFWIVLGFNALWFGAAFRYFSLTPETAAKLLVPKSARNSPLFETIAVSVRFLGGMNLALSVFAILILVNRQLFPEAHQNALFAFVFAVAHASQFAYNVPVALGGGRKGEALWPVLSGPMLLIFVVDGVLMLANMLVGIWLLVE